MEIAGDPLAFLQLDQLGNSLIRIFQLSLKFISFVPVIGGDGKQDNADQTDQDERQLGKENRVLSHETKVNRRDRS